MRMFIPLVSSVYHVPTLSDYRCGQQRQLRHQVWQDALAGVILATGNLGYDADAAKDIGDDEHPYNKGDINVGKDVLMSAFPSAIQTAIRLCALLPQKGRYGAGAQAM